MKASVFTAFNLPTFTPTKSGTGKEITYQLIHDESDGVDKLISTGVRDLHSEIQSYHDGCCIQNIIKRFQLGDESVLNVHNPIYEDVSNAPKSLIEAYNTAAKAKDLYLKALEEVKKQKKEGVKSAENGQSPSETEKPTDLKGVNLNE